MRQISRIVTAHYDRELGELGITANQLTMLCLITVLEQPTAGDMAPYLQMDASTISRNVERMVQNQWVARMPAEDRRSSYLVVSPQGQEIIRQSRPHWKQSQKWLHDMLGNTGVTAIRRLAKKLNPRIP